MNTFLTQFGTKKMVIGVIHFPPMPGHDGFPGYDVALKNAIADLEAFEKGGVDAIIIENNYDLPHVIHVDAEVSDMMQKLAQEIRNHTKVPLGICVLWNDYQTSLRIAKEVGLQFVRVPVFVDTVETDFGVVEGDPKNIIDYRKSINAQDVAIFVDVHVKHAKLLSDMDLGTSVKKAVEHGADGIIITGTWTGNPPTTKDMQMAKDNAADVAVVAGSGVDTNNISDILIKGDGVIVSTSLKEDANTTDSHERNIRNWDVRISTEKTQQLTQSVPSITK